MAQHHEKKDTELNNRQKQEENKSREKTNEKMEVTKKKIRHMWWRWGTPQNFCLAFIDEPQKKLFIKKTVEVGQ